MQTKIFKKKNVQAELRLGCHMEHTKNVSGSAG